ncbi:MAG: molecular chaperone DnaJ [Cyanobacteriota bacterium]
MPQTVRERPAAQLITTGTRQQRRIEPEPEPEAGSRGFGGARASRGARRKGAGKRSPALSRGDWGPLGKHPDLEAIVARQRLHLPLSGRLTAAQVNQAWKRCAAEHHPDRGGEHDTMQLVNGARDLLLGRDLG